MWFLFVVLFLSTVQGLERRLTYTKNPGCDKHKMAMHYIRAEGPNDTLHYIWDFTTKLRPTIFLALTDVNDNISVSCLEYFKRQPQSYNFTKKPKYEFFLVFSERSCCCRNSKSFGNSDLVELALTEKRSNEDQHKLMACEHQISAVIQKFQSCPTGIFEEFFHWLIEFNDVNDTGILTPLTPRTSYDTKLFSWASEGVFVDSGERFVTLNVTGYDFKGSKAVMSGNFSIQLTAFGFENHDSDFPRLLHSPNSTQCRISLVNLFSDSGFNESRYAIEFVLVSSDERNSSSKIVTRKNLDDENSPGIFAMVDVMTPKAQNQLFEGAFLQWRPIISTYNVPSLGNSSEVVAYNLTEVTNPGETLADSLAVLYYGWDFDSVLVERTVVSFGISEDEFYKKTNFSSWTFLVSYGSPEEEKFSLLVVLVMCIGLGLPALCILVGGTYMCARRIRRSKDELSLGRFCMNQNASLFDRVVSVFRKSA